ncbi:MAG: PepSY domain-containing protein [Bdellovibrionota bacterium]
MKGLLIVSAMLVASAAYAKKNCTEEPKEKWMEVEKFKSQLIEQGYTIKKFKQPGSCYEIYGKNKEGQDVEIYFNPVDGSIVKEKIKKSKKK